MVQIQKEWINLDSFKMQINSKALEFEYSGSVSICLNPFEI